MDRRHYLDSEHTPGSAGDLLRLVRARNGMSRSRLARETGLAASTVGLRVDSLLGIGYLHEVGTESSRGGRRARRLQIDPAAGFVATADLGANHARVVLSDLAGQPMADSDDTHTSTPIDRSRGPGVAVGELWKRFTSMAAGLDLDMARFLGAVISVPAPVAYPSGRLVTPSFEPSWNGVSLGTLFEEHTSSPVLVENDANLIALSERSATESPNRANLVAVKLGTRIGAGVIVEGRLYRGVSGAAGELSHTAVDGQSAIGCTCGVPNCLESVASGGAILARLRERGSAASTTADILELGARGDSAVIAELRTAGSHIARVLAGIANFFNPSEVVLSGAMSASPPLTAAIRSELYRLCLPLVADDLEVRACRAPRDAAVRGGTVLALDEVLAPARIEQLVHDTSPAVVGT